MNKIISVILLLVYAGYSTSAQNTEYNLTGHVLDATTGEHIPYASVFLDGNKMAVQADEDGHFIMPHVERGIHEVSASMMGYRNKTITVEVNTETISLTLKLEEDLLFLEGTVVTGTRYATRKRETATIVSITPPKLFENTLSVSSAEVLDFQPGLRVEYDCGNCGVPQLRINGLSGQYSQVLLDSHPIFSSLSMVYGLEQFPASMIERIEVVRGGGSALFGSNAIGGTVNIITKEPSGSSFNLSNQTGFIGGKSADVNTSLNGSIVSRDNRTGAYLYSMVRDRDAYDHNSDGFSDIPTLKSSTLGARAYHKFNDNNKLTAEYHHIQEFRRGGDAMDLQPEQTRITEQLQHYIDGGSLSYDLKMSENISVDAYLSAQQISRKSYFGTGGDPNAYGSTSDKILNGGVHYIHRLNPEASLPATFSLGGEYSWNRLSDNMLGYNRIIDQQVKSGGVFAQNEWSGKRLGIVAGLRVDMHSALHKPVLSPRLTFRYAPIEPLTLRASYARGFRAPQVYDEDLHVGAVGGQVSIISISENLKPEHSNSVTASADYWKVFGKWQVNLLCEAFWTRLGDVFALKENGTDEVGNILLLRVNENSATVKGINLESRLAWSEKVSFQGGMTFQRSTYGEDYRWSTDVEPQRKMHGSPDTYGYFNLDVRPFENLSLGANWKYTGKMLMKHYAGVIPVDQDFETENFNVFDLRASYHIHLSSNFKAEIFAAVKNVGNAFQGVMDAGELKDSKFIYGPALPRSYYFGLRLKM